MSVMTLLAVLWQTVRVGWACGRPALGASPGVLQRRKSRSQRSRLRRVEMMSIASDIFDYVIVGAGAAGCVLTNRLAADGVHSVCLLEAGPKDSNIYLRVPAGVYKASSDPRFAWQYQTEPHPAIANRSIPMPQGKTLGGSTAINGMNYNRGSSKDFDDWARAGNSNWGYSDILPYFKNSERRTGAFDSRYRGSKGELPITDSDWRHPVCDAFIEAANRLGLPRDDDYNGARQSGVGYYQRYIENGWRVSAARAFLRPIANNKNVDIRTNAEVVSILFEGKRAVGVRYVNARGGPAREVRARREVVLAAGAANSPKLLQLSGVGPKSLLAELGVEALHDSPGVGANLQDHYIVHLIIRLAGAKAISGRGAALLREGVKWLLGRPSVMAIGPSLVYGFVNSHNLVTTPDVQLDVALGNFAENARERFPVLKLGFFQLRPTSRGYVRAASSDPFTAPVIQPAYLAEEFDRKVAVDALRTVRRILAARPLARYCHSEVLPGAAFVEDAELLNYAREVGLTAYHLSGTCRMGSEKDPMAVVDDQLRVRGLGNLRVVDASIMPAVPSANTSAAVFMIAEKAADLMLGRGAQAPTRPDAVYSAERSVGLAGVV